MVNFVTSVVTFYRREPTGTENDRGVPQHTWEPQASDIPVTLQTGVGKIRQLPEGRQVEISARLFVDPEELGGYMPAPDDGVVVTQGRVSHSTFLIATGSLIGDSVFDDELDLTRTQEAIPGA